MTAPMLNQAATEQREKWEFGSKFSMQLDNTIADTPGTK
jgi:hypothetical protein